MMFTKKEKEIWEETFEAYVAHTDAIFGLLDFLDKDESEFKIEEGRIYGIEKCLAELKVSLTGRELNLKMSELSDLFEEK